MKYRKLRVCWTYGCYEALPPFGVPLCVSCRVAASFGALLAGGAAFVLVLGYKLLERWTQ